MDRVRLKARRLELGYTLQDVADKMKLTRSTVHKYESGLIKGIETTILEKLAEVLECTPAYLMGWSEEEEPPTLREDAITDIITLLRTDDEFLDLVKSLTSFPKERVKAIKAMIDAFDK